MGRETPPGAGVRVWKAALYTRLSREDGDKAESNSIASQKAILEGVIARDPTLSLAQVYVDDGCTGTNFDRPAFQQMLRDIEAGRIDCVMVKDDCVIIEPTQKDLENQGFVAGSICF